MFFVQSRERDIFLREISTNGRATTLCRTAQKKKRVSRFIAAISSRLGGLLRDRKKVKKMNQDRLLFPFKFSPGSRVSDLVYLSGHLAQGREKKKKKENFGRLEMHFNSFYFEQKKKKVSSSLPSSSPLSKDLGGNQIREHKVEEEGPAISPKEPLAAGNTHTHRKHNVDGNNRERLLKPARGK